MTPIDQSSAKFEAAPMFKHASVLDESGSIFTSDSTEPTSTAIDALVQELADSALEASKAYGDHGYPSYAFAFGALKSMFRDELRKAQGSPP